MSSQSLYPKCQAYPPVPNWYSSNVTAISESNLFLYATRNVIVVLDLDQMKYFNSFAASMEKINAIDVHSVLCFTAGLDKLVCVWNLLSNTLAASHDEHKAEVTALKVFRQGSVVISGDIKGKIVVSEPFGENTTVITRVNSEITCISTVTYNNVDYAAIGYANGLVFIEEIAKDLSMKTVFQTAGDNDAIQSINWQKKPTADQWPLLAFSTKRLRNIFVYDVALQKKVTSIRVPSPPSVATEQQRSTIWIEVSWSPSCQNKLYFTSYLGVILSYEITKGGPKMISSDRLDRHNRVTFSINWYNDGRKCITTSLDKQIIKWDIKKRKPIQIMKTQAAFPYALDMSIANPNQLVMGMGDNSLKIWNFQKKESVMPSKFLHDYYTANVMWKSLYAKILRIECHPFKPDLIAFADEIGRVGVYDLAKQQSQIFKAHQNTKECPLIAWGFDMSLILNDGNMVDTLIACNRDGTVYAYDAQDPTVNSIALNDLIDRENSYWADSLRFKTGFCRTAMAATRDFIAFGHMDGVVEVYSMATFKLLYISTCHNKEITTMDFKDTYLATGCQQGMIAIHNLTEKLDNIPAKIIPEIQPYKTIYKHTSGISVLKWTREPKVYALASGSEDSLVCIWEMDKLVSVFDQHRASVLSVCWDWNNHKRLFTSSMDRFVYDWNISDYTVSKSTPAKTPLYEREKLQMKKRVHKRVASSNAKQSEPKKLKASKNLEMMNESESSEKKAPQDSKGKKCLRLANILFEGRIEAVVDELKQKEITESEREDPVVANYLNVFEHDENIGIYEHIFGDKEDVIGLVEVEEKSIQTHIDVSKAETTILDRFDKQLSMNIMLSQANTLFNENSDSGVDWIILAMSPQAGKSAWCDLMKKQGRKMQKAGKHHLAASCYIACSHIYEAVEVYQVQGMFREAIALTKIRLPEDKDLLSSLFLKWANHLQTKEDYGMAAICFVLSEAKGSISNAINLLSKTNRESGFFFAACLSHIVDDIDTIQQRINQWTNKLKERLNK